MTSLPLMDLGEEDADVSKSGNIVDNLILF